MTFIEDLLPDNTDPLIIDLLYLLLGFNILLIGIFFFIYYRQCKKTQSGLLTDEDNDNIDNQFVQPSQSRQRNLTYGQDIKKNKRQ
ncbi:UNKNOWN [Stylonychia lemnae]|uniref:Uncharacterized protein n=1 Tax=Stylonychia lemnae TaxID=5949 RepID=A0A078AB16_STYLE|nr:UNKNOWN [Stylonychia lemnae]|eukprot:CDW79470.1 UNKNOWN [Stylonychia lemnae]